jgi:hypothetical protein
MAKNGTGGLGLTAGEGATKASAVGADVISDLAVDFECMFYQQLATRLNGGERVEKDANVSFDGFAVRFAVVVEDARTVAASTAIDYPTV